MAANPYITVEDVRLYIIDTSPDDNDLLADLAYTDDEIRQAMVRAARDYNSIAPMVEDAEPEKLSARTNMFLDGIAKQLYVSTLSNLTRNDMDYTAGGVGTSIVAKRIQHLKDLIKYHDEQFRAAAYNHKYSLNLDEGFGTF